jgi:hypothetical protein
MTHRGDAPPGSTLSDVRDPAGHGWKKWVRGSVVALLVLVVGLGVTGWLGVRSGTAEATGGGYALEVEYPMIARAGLDVPWTITITAPPGGFPDEITVAVTSDWFDLFETQGFSPEPTEETTDDRFDYMTLSTPDTGTTMTFSYDTYVQPAAQLGASAEVWLIVDDERVASVDYRTWLLP